VSKVAAELRYNYGRGSKLFFSVFVHFYLRVAFKTNATWRDWVLFFRSMLVCGYLFPLISLSIRLYEFLSRSPGEAAMILISGAE
jgi:hypothetical protein